MSLGISLLNQPGMDREEEENKISRRTEEPEKKQETLVRKPSLIRANQRTAQNYV